MPTCKAIRRTADPIRNPERRKPRAWRQTFRFRQELAALQPPEISRMPISNAEQPRPSLFKRYFGENGNRFRALFRLNNHVRSERVPGEDAECGHLQCVPRQR